jgi:hypothetical protein
MFLVSPEHAVLITYNNKKFIWFWNINFKLCPYCECLFRFKSRNRLIDYNLLLRIIWRTSGEGKENIIIVCISFSHLNN